MNISERLFSIFIYVLVIFFFCFLVSRSKSKYLKKILFIYAIVLAFMGFIYKPPITADVYRINEDIRLYYSNMSFETLISWMKNSTIPVAQLYFFIFGKLGVEGLISAVTGFIFYMNIFHIIQRSSEKNNLSMKNVAKILFYFMVIGQYIEVISGVRFMLGCSIVARCVIDELFDNKSPLKNTILYLLSGLIHPAVLVLVVFRFAFLLFQTEKKGVKKLLNYIIIAILTFAFLKFGNSYILGATDKAKSYLNGNIYSYKWEYLIGFINILYIMIYKFKFQKINNKNTNKEIININKFLNIVLIFVLLFASEYSIFHRYRYFATILFIPTYAFYLDYIEKNKIQNIGKFKILSAVLNFLVLFLAASRGNLCGLNFFN